MQLLNSINVVQFELFAVAAVASALLFSLGYALGRLSRASATVKVPLEVIHALASARFASAAPLPVHSAKGGQADVVHAVEAILDHVKHEKDFKKAREYALHEIEKIEHDHGETHELSDLHHKVEAAHNKHDIEVALQEFIDHAKGHH
jgi:hypothetical protein